MNVFLNSPRKYLLHPQVVGEVVQTTLSECTSESVVKQVVDMPVAIPLKNTARSNQS